MEPLSVPIIFHSGWSCRSCSAKQLPTLVPAVHVVVAHDVFRVQEREGGGMAVGGDLVVAGGDRPGRVLAVKDVDQPAQHRHTIRGALFPDLVPRAPEHDRRMVPVAADEVHHVALRPLREVLVVALGHLADGPFVERLVHDEEAEPVAQIEELRGRRVVRGADGVGPHGLQRLEPAAPDRFRHGRAEAARVVMQVHAPHLHPAAVEQEPAILVVGDGADAERRGGQVGAAARRPRPPNGARRGPATPPTRAAATRLAAAAPARPPGRRPARTASPCGRPPARRSPPPPSGARPFRDAP